MPDAWGTPGWTSQNGIPLTSDLPPVLVPLDIKTTKVVGQLGSIDGKHQTGFILFAANQDLTHIASGGVSRHPSWLGRIFDGQFKIVLPATDNTTITPGGWHYRITVVIYNQLVRSFDALLPFSATDVDYTSLVPIVP